MSYCFSWFFYFFFCFETFFWWMAEPQTLMAVTGEPLSHLFCPLIHSELTDAGHSQMSSMNHQLSVASSSGTNMLTVGLEWRPCRQASPGGLKVSIARDTQPLLYAVANHSAFVSPRKANSHTIISNSLWVMPWCFWSWLAFSTHSADWRLPFHFPFRNTMCSLPLSKLASCWSGAGLEEVKSLASPPKLRGEFA